MKLSYGNGATYELQHQCVTRVGANRVSTIAGQEVALAVREALASPLDYPNLASATVPGDSVTVALQYQTPQLGYVLEGVLAALEHAGVEKTSIKVLLAAEFVGDTELQQTLRDIAGGEVTFVLHDAGVEDQLALLGITEASRTLRLNRVLCDADLVIPVGPVRGEAQSIGTSASMFPGFSDEETRSRFQAPASHETAKANQKLAAEVRECDWMLGVGLALQIVPGPDGSVAGVFCGTPSGTANAASATYREVWSAPVPERADLVVATIVGNDTQQSWQNLSRALIAAEEVLAPGGAIAVCSEIASRPGLSGKRLRDAADLAETEQKMLKDEYADSLAALQLCRSLQRGTVYLKSRLEPGVVERLGLAPITSNQELERLVQTYRRCVVLEEAQHLLPSLAE
jgi:nickel-dependent lactate racemase